MSQSFDRMLTNLSEADRVAFRRFIANGTLHPDFETRLESDRTLQEVMDNVLDELARQLDNTHSTDIGGEADQIDQVVGNMVPVIQQAVKSGRIPAVAEQLARTMRDVFSPDDRKTANVFFELVRNGPNASGTDRS